MNKRHAVITRDPAGHYTVEIQIPNHPHTRERTFCYYSEARTWALDNVQNDPDRVTVEGMS